jgi:hypothetical protein
MHFGTRLIVALLVFAVFGQLYADEADNDDLGKVQLKRWREYYRHVAHSYEMRVDDQSNRQLTVSRESIFHYANLGHFGKSHGAFFVWTHEGRPEALGAIWSNLYGPPGTRTMVHEFHSLSLSKLSAHWNGNRVWNPRQAGVELKPIPAGSPAATRTLRLIQMRRLKERFTVYRTREGEEVLREVGQPVYRYKTTSGDTLDGAIFVYIDDVWYDPEVLLLIEARQRNGQYQWHCAGATLAGSQPARIEFDGAQVWRTTRRNLPRGANGIYHYFRAEVLKLTAPRIGV